MINLQDSDFIETVTPSIASDPQIVALAGVVDTATDRVLDDIGTFDWSDIDTAPEQILDLLAYELSVDLYDQSFTVDQKRFLIKNACDIHARKGSKDLLESIITGMVAQCTVMEWWKYGAPPYHFKVLIEDQEVDIDKQELVNKFVYLLKNVRSYYEGLEIVISTQSVLNIGLGIISDFWETVTQSSGGISVSATISNAVGIGISGNIVTQPSIQIPKQ